MTVGPWGRDGDVYVLGGQGRVLQGKGTPGGALLVRMPVLTSGSGWPHLAVWSGMLAAWDVPWV